MSRRSIKRKKNLKYYIFITIILTIIVENISMSKYSSTYIGNGMTMVAMPIFSSSIINLESVYPTMDPIEYEIVITNTENHKVSQVNLIYVLEVTNYGNIPLKIELYRVYDEEVGDENLLDVNGKTKSTLMSITEVSHTYILKVLWDETASDYKDFKYSGETNYIEINNIAVQKD